jgi:HrpA-like RNA helicase
VEIVWHDKDLWSLPVMMRAAVETVSKILESTTDGDILVFLTGVDEINTMSDELEKLNGIYNLVVLPAHGGLSPEDQNRVFSDYPGKRKVVLATNIAETSITIEGVIYVVDCGLIKQTNFNTETGIGSLDVVEHSQAGCKQRSGRAGRTKPGVCYRLYTSQNYAARPTFTLPEIKRMSLAGVVLTMEALQLPNVRDFDFIDKPDKNAFKEAYATLEASGAIEVGKSGLTSMGKEMASLPLDPWISRFIIEAKKIGCVLEAVTIAAFISVGRSVFARPKDKEMEAEAAHSFFKDTSSDMLTYLNVWREYECSGFSRGWCFKNFLMDRKLMEVQNIRQQLLQQLRYRGVEITQAKSDDDILRCVAISFAYNLLHHTCRHAYEGVGRETDDFVFVHPSSSVFGASNPSWLVAFKLVSAKKLYAWMCSVVKVEWLPEIAPTKFTFGEQMIHSYNPQTGVVTVSREIISREKGKNEGMLGFQFRQVTLAEAYEIQEDYIKKVVKSDWKLLTIEAPAGWRANSYPERGQAANGRSYGLAFSSKSFSLNAGEKYFCRPSWHDPYVFHPEFRVYDFPLENRKPALVGKVVKIRPADFKADHNSGSLGFLLEEAMKRATPTAVSE